MFPWELLYWRIACVYNYNRDRRNKHTNTQTKSNVTVHAAVPSTRDVFPDCRAPCSSTIFPAIALETRSTAFGPAVVASSDITQRCCQRQRRLMSFQRRAGTQA